MDIIQKFMNLVIPPIALTTLLFFLPPYLFFKFIISTLGFIFSENVAGKVVLITGASSGIGEHLAYEYARRGACLALVARRENSLREVASRALQLGSPDVIVVPADVSKVDDCRRFVAEAVNYFGRLDHLVNNAGMAPICMFEDYTDITKSAPAMGINFWGSAYSTYFAVPHLRKSNGKIVGIVSAAGWLRVPRMSFYCASKAALISFYETFRVEFGMDIGITIVTPGLIESEMTKGKFLSKEGTTVLDQEMRDVRLIESEMTKGKFLSKEGTTVLDQEMRDVQLNVVPVESIERCAKAIVKGACRGDRYLSVPAWIRTTFYWKVFCPELLEWVNRCYLMDLRLHKMEHLASRS